MLIVIYTLNIPWEWRAEEAEEVLYQKKKKKQIISMPFRIHRDMNAKSLVITATIIMRKTILKQ